VGNWVLHREELIEQETKQWSTVPSLTAIAILSTIIATRHKMDVDLMAKAVKAWEKLGSGTPFGELVWSCWAREALGVLDCH
jgi:hypothetical protein